MQRPGELEPTSLSIGQIVQYENKYHAACVVKILDKDLTEDHVKYKAEVLESIFGNTTPGDRFTFGRTLKDGYSHYVNWKVKIPGTMTEYVNGDYQKQKKKIAALNHKFIA